MKRAAVLLLCLLLAGCGGRIVDQDEWNCLDGVFRELCRLRERYPEQFAGVEERTEWGKDFVSFAHLAGKAGPSGALLDRGNFWFKVSLSPEPVESFDLQPPVLTAYLPQFGKYLKLRVVTSDGRLESELMEIFNRRAVSLGGTGIRASRGRSRGPFRSGGSDLDRP